MLPRPKSNKVRVTQDHIDEARQCDAAHCMLAMAIRDQIKGARSVNVANGHAKFNVGGEGGPEGGTRFTYELPGRASAAVELFDTDKTLVRPFEFQLDGRQGAAAPVLVRGPNVKSRHSKRPRQPAARTCKTRRYHGIKVVASAETVRHPPDDGIPYQTVSDTSR